MMKTALLQRNSTWLLLLACGLLLALSACGNPPPDNDADGIAPDPLLFQGRLYVDTGALNIFNPNTGTRFGRLTLDKQGDGIDFNPIIGGNTMYFTAQTGPQSTKSVYALQPDKGVGAVKWHVPVETDTDLETANTNMVYVYSDNQMLIALSASNGKAVWQYQTSFEEINSVIASGELIYICGADASLSALRATTGELLWRRHVGDAGISGAVVSQGVIYASEQGGVFALNAEDGTLIWHDALTGDANSDDVTTPLVANGTVYVVADNNPQQTLYSLQARNGQKLWQKSLPYVRLGFHPFAVAGQTLYFAAATLPPGNTAADKGVSIWALRASSGKTLWQSWLSGSARPSIVITNGVVSTVVMNGLSTATLVGLQASTGKTLWQTPIAD